MAKPKLILKVCIPHTFRDSYDYLSETSLPVIGARVWVPFRNKLKLGVVVGHAAPEKEGMILKTIDSVIDDQPILSASLLALCCWVSEYYQSPLSETIPLALPKLLRQGKSSALPQCLSYALAMPLEESYIAIGQQAKKQKALIDFLATKPEPVPKKQLTQSGFSKAQVDALLQLGVIKETQRIALGDVHERPLSMPLALNEEQALAVEAIEQKLHSYHCFLLQGVTGSGKTEVYLQVIAKVLARGRQVLILVPEIGLTPQLLQRFSERFNEPMAVMHSHLNDTERFIAWQGAAENHIKLVIGTRAAVFTPMPNLGLIVIDEEHDSSLKQMEGVRYSARDTALIRAYQSQIPVLLGSATPSLESLHNCQQNKYQRLRLTQKAISHNPLHFHLVDLRNAPIKEGIAAPTLSLIQEHLKNNNQVLVFINRRGFAPVLLCHQCGWMVDCRACDSHLTYHKKTQGLICHHCGLTQSVPRVCKHCNGKELIPVGTGTERIYDYLQTACPGVSLLRVDRDQVTRKNALNEKLAQISRGEAQLIVGTQMLAKGHHFPNLSLVVVVDVDSGFYNQDFRGLEQLGQLLTQVSGRAGRAEHPGQVVIQTHLPQHPLLNLLIKEGYDAFSSQLLATRKEACLPPYQYMALIRVEGKTRDKIVFWLHNLKTYLADSAIHVMGPAPAPLARKAHMHRMQLLLKAPSRKVLQNTLTSMREWLTITKTLNNVRWNIDVDPQDLS